MRQDIERWNRKYAETADGVEPAGEHELRQWAHVLPGRGLALELACGKGANALYLAQLGYEVVAVDGAINGLALCQRTAVHRNLAVHPVAMDLDRAVLPGQCFDLISVVRYLNRSLWPHLVKALTPGGMLFCKTFNRRHLTACPGFNARYLLDDGELDRTFVTLERLAGNETGPTSFILCRAPPASGRTCPDAWGNPSVGQLPGNTVLGK